MWKLTRNLFSSDHHLHKKESTLGKGGRRGQTQVVSKTFEKDLSVCVTKLAETPSAVDALLFVLEKILENPSSNKFKEISKTTPTYEKTLGRTPIWTSRVLNLLNFVDTGDKFALSNRGTDIVKLTLALSALQTSKETENYQFGQEKVRFEDTVNTLLQDHTANETEAKLKLMNKLPKEPKNGAAGTTTVKIHFGAESAMRLFNADDTLMAVLNFASASFHSSILHKLQVGEFELVDRTYFPPKTIEILGNDNSSYKITNEEKTLQALNLWPSGEIEIQKQGLNEREKKVNGIVE